MPQIKIHMPDGSIWSLDSDTLAKIRADEYAKETILFNHKVYHKELQYGFDHPQEMLDWATNNLDWNDVRNYATQIRLPPNPDYQEGWVNGRKEIILK